MKAISILPPGERSLRGRVQLFLRLRSARHKYEQLGPFGGSSAARIVFHLRHLEPCWSRVAAFQKVLGLESGQFLPRDQFELIHIVSGFAERELAEADASAEPTVTAAFRESWTQYQNALNRLSHDLNPFDFSETCCRCQSLLERMAHGGIEESPAIPFPAPELRLAEEPDAGLFHSASGVSKYSPGGSFS